MLKLSSTNFVTSEDFFKFMKKEVFEEENLNLVKNTLGLDANIYQDDNFYFISYQLPNKLIENIEVSCKNRFLILKIVKSSNYYNYSSNLYMKNEPKYFKKIIYIDDDPISINSISMLNNMLTIKINKQNPIVSLSTFN